MRKSKAYSNREAAAVYEAKLREDEDSERKRTAPKVTYPNWIHCNQELRNKIIQEFEDAVYEKFGAFP